MKKIKIGLTKGPYMFKNPDTFFQHKIELLLFNQGVML